LQYEAELHSRVVSERGLPEQSASNDLQNAGGFRAINQTRGTNIERAGDDAAEENWDNEITYDVSLGLAVGTVAGSSRAESVTGRRGTGFIHSAVSGFRSTTADIAPDPTAAQAAKLEEIGSGGVIRNSTAVYSYGSSTGAQRLRRLPRVNKNLAGGPA
jgi:hypothetical protein